ncbi:hypothetical protein CANCADRAFT_90613 [Tortispora caseinolytica NRRL Y-17796]|uniref:Replication factor C subunit 2 n=1 Tax=Tortispora caseinolytica NRRL Y-17796 TaxID=767744 RepID=A0A1E4TLQ1_9ASCO|nr:hypothetical protein CANCADRAFT_90613 [Tortispora caseinolytica NRRL Y-17796]
MDARQIPWVEKYRPSKLDEVAAQGNTVEVLRKSLKLANLPHMLFYGPPGTGKTSTILALCKELFGPKLMKSRVLELNASDERGINVVRKSIKTFAQLTVSAATPEDKQNYPCPPFKVIILDEADSMTQDAQGALRRIMENYSEITRFCLVCNYVTRIIDPVTSRCSKFRFTSLDRNSALARLDYIRSNEGLMCEDGVLDLLLHAANGDLRKAITYLQSASMFHQGAAENGMEVDSTTVTMESVQEITGLVPESVIEGFLQLTESIDVDTIKRAVEDAVNDGWSATQILSQFHDTIIQNSLIGTNAKTEISLLLSRIDRCLTDGADEELTLLDLLVQCAEIRSKY